MTRLIVPVVFDGGELLADLACFTHPEHASTPRSSVTPEQRT